MRKPVDEAWIALVRRASVPRGVRMIRERLGYSEAMAGQYYDFLVHGGDIISQVTLRPKVTTVERATASRTARRDRARRAASSVKTERSK